MFGINKMISGGQTGADLAGLDFALRNNISLGGWCPKGRLNESGTIARMYPLIETSSTQYSVRTEKNVMDSDATLIFTGKQSIDPGTKLCIDLCQHHQKEHFIFDLFDNAENQLDSARAWLLTGNFRTLNIAGNRESTFPGIYFKTLMVLANIFNANVETVGEAGQTN
ncbi:MAG: putative molybdenum carrier protein [Bacteroidales bacterium]|nr:putative molybdenum carrier protein [Bacteroidales bacterium]MCF8456407.1 putative molybdenum carrier protein [Bacteroidales bacterium]